MKIGKKRFSLLIIALLFSSELWANKVKLGVYDQCPYICSKTKDKPGYIAELLSGFFKEKNRELEVIPYPYSRLKEGLMAKRFDLIFMPSFEIRSNPDLVAMDKAVGVYFLGAAYLDPNKPISRLDQLKGKSVLLTRGSLYTKVIEESLFKINEGKRLVSSIGALDVEERKIDMLLLKRTEYVLSDYNILSFLIYKKKNKKVKLSTSSIAGITPLNLIVRKNYKDRDSLNKDFTRYLQKIRSNGTLELIINKYSIDDWGLYY
ncbi:MAG: ABC-type amino acid transport substrate-binding protein [Bacteriovoracaceae bacterium]|jgi:ABC-type amino acid transport substrate-binding protein